jgi:hypothetical protein
MRRWALACVQVLSRADSVRAIRRGMITQRCFTVAAVTLFCSSCCFGKDVTVKAFLAAMFASDGTSVYYLQSDLDANVRRTGSFFNSEGPLLLARQKEIRIISEAISIHKLDLATGGDETIVTLQRPPWVGTKEWEPRQFWFDGESARMWLAPDDELQYEVHGPITTTVHRQGVRETRQYIFVSSDPKWTVSTFDANTFRSTLQTELKYVVSGGMELITSWRYGDYGNYFLVVLDHNHRTVRVLLTGSDWDRSLLLHSDYEGMLYKSRLKGPVRDQISPAAVYKQ